MAQDEFKKLKEKLSSKVTRVQKKKKPVIDRKKPRKTIKGISICAICKNRHLECKKCFMDNGDQLIICNFCYPTTYKPPIWPGGYGTGKKR